MSTCVYPSYAAQVYQWTHLIPWIVPLAITAAALGKVRHRWGKQVTLVLYGTWLSLLQLILLLIQSNMNRNRPDPYCPMMYSAAYPCIEAFFVSSLTMFIAGFTFIWNVHLPWLYWTVVFCVLSGPPSILVWYQYSTWSEVLVSTLIGFGSTLMFLLFFAFVVVDSLPYLLNQVPFTWFYCIDNYAMSDQQMTRTERVRVVLTALNP